MALCRKRQALLDCAHSAKSCHHHAWASTSVELLIEHLAQHSERFCTGQQMEVAQLELWVRQQRAARKAGPSAKEVARDANSFDRARAEWSGKSVSIRGKVGANGDSKSNNWLG